MNLLLDLLDPTNCPAIQSSTLLALVTALLDTPSNTRTFENLDGLLTVTSLFKHRQTSREVKLKLVEFLYFYLMPEGPTGLVAAVNAATTSAPGTAVGGGLQRSPSKLSGGGRAVTMAGEMAKRRDSLTREVKSTDEKQELLGRYLDGVGELVEDLRRMAPFGSVAC